MMVIPATQGVSRGTIDQWLTLLVFKTKLITYIVPVLLSITGVLVIPTSFEYRDKGTPYLTPKSALASLPGGAEVDLPERCAGVRVKSTSKA